MPVFPLVGSIRVSPGLISPRSWARRIIDSAGRSFTDPAGLLPSSFARMTFVVSPGKRFSCTSGVFPTKSSRVFIAQLFPEAVRNNVARLPARSENPPYSRQREARIHLPAYNFDTYPQAQ